MSDNPFAKFLGISRAEGETDDQLKKRMMALIENKPEQPVELPQDDIERVAMVLAKHANCQELHFHQIPSRYPSDHIQPATYDAQGMLDFKEAHYHFSWREYVACAKVAIEAMPKRESVADALRPFAVYAERYIDPPGVVTTDNVQLWQDGHHVKLTVGDLRRAAKALTEIEGGK